MCMWTFMGQAFISLFQKLTTAQGYGGLLVSLCNLLAGVIVYPQDIHPQLRFFYWFIPSHYVVEGILMSQYADDETSILASVGSPFHDYLKRMGDCTGDSVCEGKASEWMQVTFDGYFSSEHIWLNVLYLTIVCSVSRLVTFLALVNLNYSKM